MQTTRAGSSGNGENIVVALMAGTTVALVTSMAMIGPVLKMLAQEFDISVGEAGQLGTTMAVPWAITALLAGPFLDRRGRKRMLVLSLLALGAATCASAVAPSFGSLLVLRALAGLVGGAAPSAVTTIVGERVAPARRGRAMGFVFSGFGIAAVTAVPAVGAAAGLLGWRVAFAIVGATLIALAAIVAAWLAPDPPRPARTAATDTAGRLPYLRVFLAERLWVLVVANVHERVAYASFSFYLATFLMDAYQLDTVAVAVPLSLCAAGAVAGNVVGGQLADRWSRPLVYAATLCVSAAFALLLFELPVGLFVSTSLGFLFGLANAASRPAFMAVATQVSPEHRGTAMGIISSSSQAGWALGAALGGLAIELGATHGLAALTAATSVLAALWMVPLRNRAAGQPGAAPAGAAPAGAAQAGAAQAGAPPQVDASTSERKLR